MGCTKRFCIKGIFPTFFVRLAISALNLSKSSSTNYHHFVFKIHRSEDINATSNTNPYEKLLYCVENDPNYCEEHSNGVLNSCKNIPKPKCTDANGKEATDCYGVCVYADYCDANKPCKDIGTPETGIVYSKCDFAKGDNGKCQFAEQIAIGIKFD